MGTRRQRREAAQSKARKRRMTIMALCAICLVAIIIAIVIYVATRPDSRVFAVPGGQSVALYENGRFVAKLFHNVTISGTFTEDVNGGITVVSFTHNGTTVSTQIEDDVLVLPVPWRATCIVHIHEIAFPLVQ